MRHQKAKGKLSRDSAHRKALMMNLSKEIIEHERIETTAAKAKAVKPEVEKLMTLEYDGGGFAGWGRQPGLRTVQEELEGALRTILGETGVDGRPLRLTVAGRTDAGVHAWGQVASYAHEAVDPQRLNSLLADDL